MQERAWHADILDDNLFSKEEVIAIQWLAELFNNYDTNAEQIKNILEQEKNISFPTTSSLDFLSTISTSIREKALRGID